MSSCTVRRTILQFGAMERICLAVSSPLRFGIDISSKMTSGWNEAHGRAATYTFTNGVISTEPHVGDSAFTVNHGKLLLQPRLGLAWSPFGNSKKTVIRAGFGRYDDLQDALGYGTDQNAP